MIISQTPLRVSFVGGGTDLPPFYRRHGGAVVSTAIAHYVYITLKELQPFHDHRYRVSYSRTELCRTVAEIQHPLVRECLRLLAVDAALEITSIADVPAGTGLGSSSSFTVGLLNALHAFKGEYVPWQQLAEEACQVEIEILGEPIGKQDQFIAAAGGLRHIVFRADDTVTTTPLICSRAAHDRLWSGMLALHVGGQRQAKDILKQWQSMPPDIETRLEQTSALTRQFLEAVQAGAPMAELGGVLHAAWELKRATGSKVSTARIDALCQRAREHGALGGKLLGAGGTGFLLLLVEPEQRAAVRAALSELLELALAPDVEGSRIIHYRR
ncbi:MAG: GHMP kinase [Pseudomonadota bacterium]